MELDDYVMLSELQHYVYCPRQWALIHLENVWDENIYTLRGQQVHEKVNVPEGELVEGIRVERSLRLWCHNLGLYGVGDVVEFLADGTPYPVEYKSGKKKKHQADEVQLCAQAICLEEMFNQCVPKGAIFYDRAKRRYEVVFTPELRTLVIDTATKVRELMRSWVVPTPVADARCPECSLIDACMPYALKDFPQSAGINRLFDV